MIHLTLSHDIYLDSYVKLHTFTNTVKIRLMFPYGQTEWSTMKQALCTDPHVNVAWHGVQAPHQRNVFIRSDRLHVWISGVFNFKLPQSIHHLHTEYTTTVVHTTSTILLINLKLWWRIKAQVVQELLLATALNHAAAMTIAIIWYCDSNNWMVVKKQWTKESYVQCQNNLSNLQKNSPIKQ